MKTCRTCRSRDVCTKLCPRIEGILPKDDTGKDSHRELNMAHEDFEAVLERYSYSEWRHAEIITSHPKLDLSRLSYKEKRAVLLTAAGLSQSEAAARLKISRLALRTHLNRALAKLRVARFSHLIEGENKAGQLGGKGGSR